MNKQDSQGGQRSPEHRSARPRLIGYVRAHTVTKSTPQQGE